MLATAAAAAGAARPAGAQALPAEVRIGFQKGAATLVLARRQQVVEQRLQA
ncbi:sulfonate ABC transporter substrate-binding protein, partial [Rubrivivax gelatinosus]|nr:sulfonate ABC transporter substrate-binding protein [Rubrivivax gelatinosus]